MDIKYRFIDSNSESEISQWLDLHAICFQYKISRNLWNHLFLENPFHRKSRPLVFVAESDDQIVGSISLIPSQIRIFRNNNRQLPTSLLVCKVMVHPDYQKKGIFSQLFKKSMETAESEGYDIMLVIPNSPYSYQHFQKIGFLDVAAMERFKFLLSPDTLTSKYVNSTLLPVSVKKLLVSTGSFLYSRLIPRVNHSYEIGFRDISECIGQISDFNNSDRLFGKIQGLRSNAFIRWKFFQEGAVFKCLTLSENGKILGYLIIQYKEGDNNAFVVDMAISKNDRAVISVLISEARQYLQKNNFERLWIYIMENDSLLSNFFSLRNGFLPRTPKSGKLSKSRFLIRSLNNNLDSTFFSDKHNWNIQSCDTCLFLE